MNDKQDNQLNLALELTPEQLQKSEGLNTGLNEETDEWELIVRYQGSLERIRELGVTVKELSAGYAVLHVPRYLVDTVTDFEEIIFVEKPKRLEYAVLNAKRVSCINPLQQETGDFQTGSGGLFGEGVIIGIADSGIDYTNSAFLNQDGTTRILKLWDQVTDIVYDSARINEALRSDNPYSIVPSRDVSGHGTHVAGIAAGNYAENKNNSLGIATKSDLIIVKMATESESGFPRTTQLMEAVDFIEKEANARNTPFVINISFGNTYGSHDGTSLLSTYLDSVADGNRASIVIGSGNEGDSAGHTGGYVEGETQVELQVSSYQTSFSVQLWKNYVDIWGVEVVSPSGQSTPLVDKDGYILDFTLDGTNVYIVYGTPKPYSRYQEIYIDFIPEDRYVAPGIWTFRMIPERIVNGRYDMWLPGSAAINENTKFLRPDPYITLTVPSATMKAITVGAYNSNNDTLATFSGRGFTRENNQIKPDLVAPGVDIRAASNTGGTTVRSGTSMAAPFVSGSIALMMEWGLVRGNDPFLYGEKVKAYLIRGARQLPGPDVWPNPQAGWGALCLGDSLPNK